MALTRAYHLRLAVRLEAVLSAHVLEVRVLDCKVAGKHGRRDLAAVGTVADKRVDEALALDRLFVGAHASAYMQPQTLSIAPEHLTYKDELHGAAITASRGFSLLGPAVFNKASEWNVGLVLVSGAHTHRLWRRLV